MRDAYQKTTPHHCRLPHFFNAESFYTPKNGDVSKKLELNISTLLDPDPFHIAIAVFNERKLLLGIPDVKVKVKPPKSFGTVKYC